MRPFVGRCQLGLGLVAQRDGRAAEAAHHLDLATTTFTVLEMAYWVAVAREVTR